MAAVDQEKEDVNKSLSTIDKRSVSFIPKNLEEAMSLARVMAGSSIVPKEFQGQPANTLIALMFGAEMGMSAAQSLTSIMVVNGRPAVWGDAIVSKVLASGQLEWFKDGWDDDKQAAWFRAKRKGNKEVTERWFSLAEAKAAGLTGKSTWQSYPKRMAFNRARAFCLRDLFSDVIRGVSIVEEMNDVIEGEAVETVAQSDNKIPRDTNSVQEQPAPAGNSAAEARAALKPAVNKAPMPMQPLPEPGTVDGSPGEQPADARPDEPGPQKAQPEPVGQVKSKRKPF